MDGLLATSNGAAKVAMLQLAMQAKRARLREREADIDAREWTVRASEREATEDARAFADWERWADERYAAVMAEIEELEHRRDALLLNAGVLERPRAGGLAGEGVAAEERGTPVSSGTLVPRTSPSVDEQTPREIDDEPTYPPETDAGVLPSPDARRSLDAIGRYRAASELSSVGARARRGK